VDPSRVDLEAAKEFKVWVTNQPGTMNEYPNWRVPLTDPDGKPVLLEDLFVSDRARSIFAVLDD